MATSKIPKYPRASTLWRGDMFKKNQAIREKNKSRWKKNQAIREKNQLNKATQLEHKIEPILNDVIYLRKVEEYEVLIALQQVNDIKKKLKNRSINKKNIYDYAFTAVRNHKDKVANRKGEHYDTIINLQNNDKKLFKEVFKKTVNDIRERYHYYDDNKPQKQNTSKYKKERLQLLGKNKESYKYHLLATNKDITQLKHFIHYLKAGKDRSEQKKKNSYATQQKNYKINYDKIERLLGESLIKNLVVIGKQKKPKNLAVPDPKNLKNFPNLLSKKAKKYVVDDTAIINLKDKNWRKINNNISNTKYGGKKKATKKKKKVVKRKPTTKKKKKVVKRKPTTKKKKVVKRKPITKKRKPTTKKRKTKKKSKGLLSFLGL